MTNDIVTRAEGLLQLVDPEAYSFRALVAGKVYAGEQSGAFIKAAPDIVRDLVAEIYTLRHGIALGESERLALVAEVESLRQNAKVLRDQKHLLMSLAIARQPPSEKEMTWLNSNWT